MSDQTSLTDDEREALARSIEATVNFHSIDAAAEMSDFDIADAILDTNNAATSVGVALTVERIIAARVAEVERERDEAIAARGSHFDARNMLGQKIDALEATLAEVRRTSRYLPCDGLCRDYPEEDCSLHGREPAELWEAIVVKNDRADAAERRLAAVEALADEFATVGESAPSANALRAVARHAVPEVLNRHTVAYVLGKVADDLRTALTTEDRP